MMNQALNEPHSGADEAESPRQMPLSENAAPSTGGEAPSLRRTLLHVAARVAPVATARKLARRYLSSPAALDLARATARGRALHVPCGPQMCLLRHAARGDRRGRVLLVHGHDGHVRQFARMIRALQVAGQEVDALILPGHLRRDLETCSMATIAHAIRDAVAQEGPYDGIIAHCVSANGLLFALGDGLLGASDGAVRVVLISTPVDLQKLVRLGGHQYGIGGRCLAAFEQEVSRLGAPYHTDTPWRPIAEARREPMLVVHARQDYAAPVGDARALAAAWPGAQLAEFEEGDHNSIVHVNRAIETVTAFLSR